MVARLTEQKLLVAQFRKLGRAHIVRRTWSTAGDPLLRQLDLVVIRSSILLEICFLLQLRTRTPANLSSKLREVDANIAHPPVGFDESLDGHERMLRDYIELPLPVRILCLGSLVNRAGSFVLIFLTIYANEELGFGVGFATACMGVLGLGSICGAILGGQLADQIGRRIVMLIALIGGAAFLLILGSLHNRRGFMATVGLFAFVSDMYRPAASAMIADHVDVVHRPHAFALMYISINLGFAIAPPLGGFLAEFSFRWLFWGDAITMFVYGLIVLTLIPESRPTQSDSSSETVGDIDAQPPTGNTTPMRQAVVRIARDKPFMLLCLSTLLIAIVFMQGMSTLPICRSTRTISGDF